MQEKAAKVSKTLAHIKFHVPTIIPYFSPPPMAQFVAIL